MVPFSLKASGVHWSRANGTRVQRGGSDEFICCVILVTLAERGVAMFGSSARFSSQLEPNE